MDEGLQIADVANQNSSKQLQMHVRGSASEFVDAEHFSCMWRARLAKYMVLAQTTLLVHMSSCSGTTCLA